MVRKSPARRKKRANSTIPASRTGVLRRSEFRHLEPVFIEIDGEEVSFTDYPAIGKAYAEAVVAKRQPACRLHIAACARYLRMLDLAEKKDNDFYFSARHVIDYCDFAERLQHTEEGSWRHTQDDAQIILEPWQIWVECAIHGFRWRGTHERVVSRAYQEVPRKHAKSEVMGIAALYDLCCSGQEGPQVVIGASTENQADRVFTPIARMAEKEDELKAKHGLKITTKEVRSAANNGQVFKLTSQGEHQDGLNPSLAIMEEMHAQKETVYRVVNSARGARPNSLMRIITTAGYHASGVGFSLRKEAELILTGTASEDYSLFALICTIDPEDYIDPETKEQDFVKLLTDQSLMIKANPMWGISIDPRKIMEQAREAQRSPDKRGEFLRTRYNLWNNAGASLIDPIKWQACKDKTLSLGKFFGRKCWIGVDLASEQDMCAIGLVFDLNSEVIAVFARYFLPRLSPTVSDPDLFATLDGWENDGHLTVTEGGMADYDRIQEEIEAMCEVFDVQAISFDPYQSNQMMKRLFDKNLPVARYANNALTMTMPTDNVISRVSAGKIAHEGHPILDWNMGNVCGERKGNGSIMPRKDAPNSNRKIDGAVAIIMANGSKMDPAVLKTEAREATPAQAYATRGIIGFKEVLNG